MLEKHLDVLYKKLCHGDESVIQEISNYLERIGVEQGEDSLTYLGRKEFLVIQRTRVSKKTKGALVLDVEDLGKVRADIFDSRSREGHGYFRGDREGVTLTKIEGAPTFTVEFPCGTDVFDLVAGDLYMGGRGKGRPRLVVRKPVEKTRATIRLNVYLKTLFLYRVDAHSYFFNPFAAPWHSGGVGEPQSIWVSRVELRK